MKFKTDENLGAEPVQLLRSKGHDVVTVRKEGLSGAPDERVSEACRSEERALISLDHDFGNVLRFPPARSFGIVILVVGRRVTPRIIQARLNEFLRALELNTLGNDLWIVEPGRIRIHQRRDNP